MSIELETINITIDVKKAILLILGNSDTSFDRWLECESGHGYVKEMNSNNLAIRAILESIKSK
jgi:hypothetical protein